ncbi:hypothetical protein MXB_2968 [Myxobolus squamalis]|nr:hypothetical protein MXB_2968 [Myxobolus squamalis]
MIRRKYITYILLLIIIWFLIIIKLNSSLYSDSDYPSYRSSHPKILSIGYFKRYYRLSIDEEPSNHYGEYGKAVEITEGEAEEKKRRFNLHKFNELASIKMPILRKLPEKRRHIENIQWTYLLLPLLLYFITRHLPL